MRELQSCVIVVFAVAGALFAAAAPFDFYVLSLSWAPAFCAQPGAASGNPAECATGKRIGFIVHGLWPEVTQGKNPEACGPASQVPKPVVNLILPDMLSPGLIQHEWATHGTCTGLNAFDYFSLVLQARSAAQIPVQITSLDSQIRESPAEIEEQFGSANPAFPKNAFRTSCPAGIFQEERVCFEKNLKARACAVSVGECTAREIVVLPPR
jgi:ribonuclease T2